MMQQNYHVEKNNECVTSTVLDSKKYDPGEELEGKVDLFDSMNTCKKSKNFPKKLSIVSHKQT